MADLKPDQRDGKRDMRRLLDFTRTGRWLTLTVDLAATPAERQTQQEDGKVRRAAQEKTVEKTTTGKATAENALPGNATAQETTAETRGATSPIGRLLEYTISGHWRAENATAAEPASDAEELQQLLDSTFFGLDVEEIPAEKWREIAPLFER
jgi:hypothetical protein